MKTQASSSIGRRTFLGLTAALTAGGLATRASGQSAAKAVPPGPPAGVVTATFGEFKITALLDGVIPLPRQVFSGDEKAIDAAMAQVGLKDGVVPAPVSAFVFERAGKKVLVDAGMGAIEGMGPGFGQVASALNAAGIKADQIDTVFITHAHPDHVGGMLTADGKAVFANAELVIAEKEVAFWNSKEIMASAPDGAKGIFQFAQTMLAAYGDRVSQVAPGKEIAKGITVQAAAGHTPGHSVLRVDGGKQELMMVADLFHSAELYTALPDIAFGYDVDSNEAAATRRRLFDQLAADKTIVVGSHAHFPGFGRILKDGTAYRYIPVTIA